MKKILILYTSIGLGHKSIAENIGFYLEQAGFTVELHDAQKIEEGVLTRWGAKLYGILIGQFPFIWSWLYNTKCFIALTLPLRIKVAGYNYKNILEVINNFKPDAVISTHNTPSAVLAYLKKENLYTGKFGITFSDFHLHRYWLFGQCDFYLANIEEQKQEMISLGIPAEKITVCGMTLKPIIINGFEFVSDFAKASSDAPSVSIESKEAEEIKNKIRKKFEIDPGAKVILMASGSQGTGIDQSLIYKLLEKPKTKIIVVCGKNKELFEDLSQKLAGSNAIILGYYSPMQELYSVADIFITKPGGLSMAEAFEYKMPIMISHLLPGQEEWNYEYLMQNNLVMPEALNISSTVLEELETGVFKKALQNNPSIQKIFKPKEVLIEAVNKALI